MKQQYFLVETDMYATCLDVLNTFTSKTAAIEDAKHHKRVQNNANALRRAEGSRERRNNRYFVLNSYSEDWERVPSNAIVCKATTEATLTKKRLGTHKSRGF